MTARIVPFIDTIEFLFVYSCIENDWSTAIARINAWKTRGKIPPAIDSSCILMEALSASSTCSHNSQRLLLSMAFIRFFNSLTDQAQTGKYAQSVASLAEHLGFPGWFVDLRHAATHDYLPCLSVLENGCSQALDWLRENYWRKMIQVMRPGHENDTIFALLKQYKVARRAELKKEEAPRSSLRVLESLCLGLPTCQIISKLIGIGYLIPSSKSQRSSGRDYKINDTLLDLWLPFLKKIDDLDRSFMFALFLQMVETVYTPTDQSSVSSQCTLGMLASLLF